jgi:hypothetical protein
LWRDGNLSGSLSAVNGNFEFSSTFSLSADSMSAAVSIPFGGGARKLSNTGRPASAFFKKVSRAVFSFRIAPLKKSQRARARGSKMTAPPQAAKRRIEKTLSCFDKLNMTALFGRSALWRLFSAARPLPPPRPRSSVRSKARHSRGYRGRRDYGAMRGAIFLHQGAQHERSEDEDQQFNFVACQSHGRWCDDSRMHPRRGMGDVSAIGFPGSSFRTAF